MRNNFGAKEARSSFGKKKNPQISSPDQLALVWNERGEVITALPIPGEVSGTFDMDLTRYPADLNLVAALQMRRASQPELPPLSPNTLISTTINDFSERTRILALDGNALALDDDDLADWLMNAEQQITLGIDNFPIFETALEDTACSVTRLPNGQVSMTEVPRQQIRQTRERIEMLLGQEEGLFNNNLAIETPLRCVARYFLNALPEGNNVLRPGKELEVTAFLLITRAGFSYGLWSPTDGLFSEYAFLAPAEIKNFKGFSSSNAQSFSANKTEKDEINLLAQNYVQQAFEQLYVQLSPERLEQMGLTDYSQIVWTAEIELVKLVTPIAADYKNKTGIDFFQINIPSDEAIASGLLFGSFNFGDPNFKADENVPNINLARDLLAEADSGAINRQNIEQLMGQKRHNRAVFALLAAPVMALALLLGLVGNLIRNQAWLAVRDTRADIKTAELKPALDRRKSYEASLKWYQEFITQVSRLRRQQPVSINLQHELDSRYPLDIDPSFYVSDLKLLVNGSVEIKGLAQNKDSITSFLKALEFAGGATSGTKLFSNLTYEVQEGTPITVQGQTNLPTAGRTNLANNLAPGIVAWNIKGNYLPMAEFVPPDPNKKPAPNTPPAPNASPAPAASPAK